MTTIKNNSIDPESLSVMARELESKSTYDDMDRIGAEMAVTHRLISQYNLIVESSLNLASGPAAHHTAMFLKEYPRAKTVCVDISAAFIRLSGENVLSYLSRPEYESIAGRYSFEVGDMRSLRFDPEIFDFISMYGNSFGFFDNEKNLTVLREMHRTLRKGGIALITVPNYQHIKTFTRAEPLKWIEEGHTSWGFITVKGERYFDPERGVAIGKYEFHNETTRQYWVKTDISLMAYPFQDDGSSSLSYEKLGKMAGFSEVLHFPLTASQTRNAKGLMERMDCLAFIR